MQLHKQFRPFKQMFIWPLCLLLGLSSYPQLSWGQMATDTGVSEMSGMPLADLLRTLIMAAGNSSPSASTLGGSPIGEWNAASVTQSLTEGILQGLIKGMQSLDEESLKKIMRPLAQGLVEGLSGGVANFTDGGMAAFLKSSGPVLNQQMKEGFLGIDSSILEFIEKSFGTASSGLWQVGLPIVMSGVLYYGFKYGFQYGGKVAMTWAMDRLLTPPLVLEKGESAGGHYWKKWRNIKTPSQLAQLKFPAETSEQLAQYQHSLNNSIKYKKGLPRLLLVGPPGTGKTEIAKRLAVDMGFNFVTFSGSSLMQYQDGKEISMLTNLIKWAERKSYFDYRKVLVFIDEIEALLAKRGSRGEKAERLLAHFLTLTGELSPQYTIVGATNIPRILDDATYRRFTQRLEVPLPDLPTRVEILKHYMQHFVLSHPEIQLKAQFLAQENEEIYQQLARDTEGLPGAELKEICSSLQDRAYGKVKVQLTPEDLQPVLQRVRDKYRKDLKYIED